MRAMKSILFSALLAIATVAMAQDPWVYAKEASAVWPGADAKAALVLGDGILTVGEAGLIDIMEGEVLMTKTDFSGNVLWEQSHDKPGSIEIVNRIAEVPSDGGFLISTLIGPSYRPWFLKTDASGNMVWESSAWSDLLGENTAAQTYAYQLPSGDIACVVANDVFRQLNIYTVDNTTGNLISTTTHLYEDLIGLTVITASTGDIINTADGGFLFATRFGVPDTFYCDLIKMDAGLNLEERNTIGYATDNFFPTQININLDGSVLISGARNTGFFADNYQATIARCNTAYDFINFQNVSGGLLHSNCGDISQTPSGNYKLIRYNFSGDTWDMAVGDYVEIVHLNSALVETGTTVLDYAPYNAFEFVETLADDRYVTGGVAWTIGEPTYYLVIASGPGDVLPDCIFNCVWPGDADNSGLADMDDLLAIGLGYGATGDARDDMSIGWYGHNANDWATALPSGENHKYVDCNGDGIINDDDTTAVSANFSLAHAVYALKTTEGEVQLIFAPDGPLHIGENSIPILLGNATESVDAIYGIRFTAIVEGEDIDAASVKINFNNSFIGNVDDVLHLSKTSIDVAAAAGAVAKTDHNNASGYGQIGTLNFVVIDNIAGKTEGSPVSLRFENVKAIDVNDEELSIVANDVTVESPNAIVDENSNAIIIYPNPVTGNELNIADINQVKTIQLFNMYGQMVFSLNTITSSTIILPELANGQYVLEIQTATGKQAQILDILKD